MPEASARQSSTQQTGNAPEGIKRKGLAPGGAAGNPFARKPKAAKS